MANTSNRREAARQVAAASRVATDRAKTLKRDLGEALRRARKAEGLSHADAAPAGVGRTYQQRWEDPEAPQTPNADHIDASAPPIAIAALRVLAERKGCVVLPAPIEVHGDNDVTRVLAISSAAANVIRAGSALVSFGPESMQLELFERECERVVVLASEGMESARRRLRAKRGGAR